MNKTPIKDYVKELLAVVARMQQSYPQRRFTLDGRLVGDIGEVLAEQMYDLELLEVQHPTHDAKSGNRLIQIKTTMKNSLTFGDIPKYYLGLRVDQNGDVDEIFNGPGGLIWKVIKNRKRSRYYLHSITINKLRELNEQVREKDRIKKRG